MLRKVVSGLAGGFLVHRSSFIVHCSFFFFLLFILSYSDRDCADLLLFVDIWMFFLCSSRDDPVPSKVCQCLYSWGSLRESRKENAL